jgi:hypothetical protein
VDLPATSDNIPGTLVLRDNTGGFVLKPASIVDADISASAAIADTKLATISTVGKVSNSATTATSANTVNSIISRDASGNFSAGTITANVAGNASTATTLAAGRTIALTGDVTGTTGTFNGSTNVTAATTIANNAVTTAKIADASVTNDKLSLAANAGEIKKAINADNDPPIYACRAWVSFDGGRNSANTGASTNGSNVLIKAAGNVASVLKNATGDYTITFTTAMPDANYAIMGTSRDNNTIGILASPSTSSFTVHTRNTTGTFVDGANNGIAIFR